jgi:hypothetical protein
VNCTTLRESGKPETLRDGGDAAGPDVAEYCSHGVLALGDGVPKTVLLLTLPREPDVPYPAQADDWVCANDFGDKAGDKADRHPPHAWQTWCLLRAGR